MIYVVLIIIAVILAQLFLANYPIGGLILPMASMFGVIVSGMILFAPSGSGWKDSRNQLSLLLFLLLTAVTFLIYFLKRRKEYQEGYLNNEKTEKRPDDSDSEN